MQADAAFSYSCRRCGRCCRNKRIQVNPYEIAKLAGGVGQGTADFREAFIVDGAYLKQRDDGTCVFFDPAQGCAVHADRHLVCRLFPLGRRIDDTGAETYILGEFDPPAAGDYGTGGTVADFVGEQGAHPFIAFADAYFRWYLKASRPDAEFKPEADGVTDLLDIDAMLAAYCARTGEAEPQAVEDRARLHLRILDDLVIAPV